jgi:LuxR family maltose regulon positive regulatory protein
VGHAPDEAELRGRLAGADENYAAAAVSTLTPRERSIVELIGQGRSNKEIARILAITPETVKSHMKHIFTKLGVERRAEAVYRTRNLGPASDPARQGQRH